MTKDWAALAAAINTRLAELGMTQRELAERSDVSPATLRQLQNPDSYEPKRRSPRLLAAISEGLRWPHDHLAQVLEGSRLAPEVETPLRDEVAQLRGEVAELRSRVDELEAREATR
ncbi:helix-turn-helix transcriptional regulator [Saccharopolyspora sp. NPDC000359]|uniref:helix-turn-helix domain-containing protein n=1 Tax=Saccharopolyspora sp. NPDC000359 TaxID=3154251 RepID=UPI0033168275